MTSAGVRKRGSASGPEPTVPIDQLLQIALAHQRDAVLITEANRIDPRGRRIVFVNAAFTAITGFTPAEAIGQTPGLTVGADTDPHAIDNIQAAIERKAPVRQEILKYRKDGTTFWAEIDIAPVLDTSGGCDYFVAVMRDITEKKRQGELLQRQAIALERASALKSQFLANMSHELRTPLNAILGYVTNLLEGIYGDATPRQVGALSRVHSNSRHLLAVINEVLDITRIEAGRMPIHLAEFSIAELIAEVLVEMEPVISRSGLIVSATTRDDLPRVLSDRHKVKQILLNLVSNALKFTHEGWVRLEAEWTPGSLSISVSDSGIGIAAEDHERVLRDFEQVDSSLSRSTGGTGLGLSICRRLAALLGGEIALVSTLGRGSTLTLRLPLEA